MSCHALLRVCGLFLLLFVFYCDRSWGSAISLDEYRSSIQKAVSRVESENGRLNAEDGAFLEERFQPRLDVNTKSGDPVQVDNGRLLGLVKQAQETDQGREALLAHLKALRNQISFVDKPIPLSEDRWGESHTRLQDVFGAKEFQDLEEEVAPRWMVFLAELLKKVVEWMNSHRGAIQSSGEWMEYVFCGVILGGVLLLGWWILRTLGPVGWRFRDPKIRSELEKKASGMDWQGLREESRQKGETGAYREAVRLFFISVLMEGHEQGWWIYRREATNREHLRSVEGSTGRRDALGKMIRVYENVWYGHESPGKEALSQCIEWLQSMEAG